MDETPYETKAVVKPAAKPKVAVVEVLNDCGHGGPGYVAASGTGTVVHCAQCSGRSS